MTPALLVPDSEFTDRFNEFTELDASGPRGLTLGGRSPALPPDAVLVMLGEGARAWFPSKSHAGAIAVPTHEMSLREMNVGELESVVRSDGLSVSGHAQTRFWKLWWKR